MPLPDHIRKYRRQRGHRHPGPGGQPGRCPARSKNCAWSAVPRQCPHQWRKRLKICWDC